jgi:hypothetical protein
MAKEFPNKYLKKLPEGFETNMAAAESDELKKKILESEAHIYEIMRNKDDDEKLNGARLLAKELSQPYRDAKSTEMAKIQYCLYLLEGRGNI